MPPPSRHLRHLFVACFFCSNAAMGQQAFNARPILDKFIAEKDLPAAQALVEKTTRRFLAEHRPDSVNEYIFYTGKIAQLQANADQGVREVEGLVGRIKALSPPPAILQDTYIEAGEYYGFAGKNILAYRANQQAYALWLRSAEKKLTEQGAIQSNLGAYAQRMGDLSLSQHHYRQALKSYTSDPNPNYEKLYMVYNGMASIMWYISKLDSSLYFYNKAGDALGRTPPTIENKYYRKAILENNISGLYSVQGKVTDAIGAMKRCIVNLKNFQSSKEPSQKKNAAISFQFEATDNLGGIYKELGDYRQAEQLLMYSYGQKQKNLDATDPAIFISQILLGQLYFAMKEYDKTSQYLNQGLDGISKAGGDYLFWQGDACNTLAQLYDVRQDKISAAAFFERADQLYEESLAGEYDNIYLEFLNNAALFYAGNGMQARAVAKANKGYQYIVKTEGAESLLGFYQLLNLSEVYFAAGDYRHSLDYASKGLSVVDRVIRSSENLLDSIKMELKKPKAILLKSRSAYFLLPKKSVSSLSGILTELNQALDILQKRKTVLQDAKDIGLLMADHSDLLDFVKTVTLDLYHLTGDEKYADQLILLHESGIYTRIRSRLDQSDQLKFAHLPAEIQETERKLKAAIVTSLNTGETHDEHMQAYLQSIANWERFVEKLKKDYPRYYQMRYASIFNEMPSLQSRIPAGTTVVRYFFTGNVLMALVAGEGKKQLIQLDSAGLKQRISLLLDPVTGEQASIAALHDLYQQLWLPLVGHINTGKLVIMPDGILYRLNFELLTPGKISSYAELGTKSLLARYTISYQYSLFLLRRDAEKLSLNNDFIAFAPGFSDQVKKQYLVARGDSPDVDNSYLNLLPQPFATALVIKAQKLLGGNTFLFDKSTLHSFKENAGKNRIIHIGTHAESDNLHPEFSRLIFAKDTAGQEDGNSLYLFDIYNCDLSSNLTVLTACESGRPGYMDGEGMISLAHAFSYAGSESIITGLWKIDEQISSQLMDLFYHNLQQGMPKDEALRKAKLSYLGSARGRMLSPQYWAGLVLMGDTAPVYGEPSKAWIWIIVLVAVAVLIFYLYRKLIYKRWHQ